MTTTNDNMCKDHLTSLLSDAKTRLETDLNAQYKATMESLDKELKDINDLDKVKEKVMDISNGINVIVDTLDVMDNIDLMDLCQEIDAIDVAYQSTRSQSDQFNIKSYF